MATDLALVGTRMRSLTGMRWPRPDEPFRKTDFTERAPVGLGRTQPSPNPIPETRSLVFARRDELLPLLLDTPCSITAVGGDWHVRCRSREATDRLLALLKLRKIRGVIKSPKGGRPS